MKQEDKILLAARINAECTKAYLNSIALRPGGKDIGFYTEITYPEDLEKKISELMEKYGANEDQY